MGEGLEAGALCGCVDVWMYVVVERGGEWELYWGVCIYRGPPASKKDRLGAGDFCVYVCVYVVSEEGRGFSYLFIAFIIFLCVCMYIYI